MNSIEPPQVPLQERPYRNRRSYQKALQRRKRQMRKRRQARIRRIRMIRTLRSARFWSKSGIAALVFFLVAFWAKFAMVYDIPDYAKRGALANVKLYVTVKPWWFGPPLFDLARYGPTWDTGDMYHEDPYLFLKASLGPYHAVLDDPIFVWVLRTYH
jgi:hypothetical protein